MSHPGFFFFPFTFPFFLALVLLALFVFVLIEINAIGYAYERPGIHQRYIFLELLLSLVGSYINIPVAQFLADWARPWSRSVALEHLMASFWQASSPCYVPQHW